MKTILLTGSDGFIGGHIATELLNNGYKVVGIDNHSKYKIPCVEHHNHPNFRFEFWDLTRPLKQHSLFESNYLTIDVIIHTAAKIGGIKYFHDYPFDLIKDNSIIDGNIIDFGKSHSDIKFIGLSSSMVYENSDIFPSPEDIVDKIPPPTSSYGFSKLTMERMIKAAYDQYGLNYIIIRPFNAIGVGENDFLEDKSSHVLPDLIVKCLQSKTPLEILGSGNQIRCYTAAKDIAKGIRLALENENAINKDFNLSTSRATTVLQLAEIVWNKIYPDRNFEYISNTPYKYDIQKRIPDINKAKQILNFETEISLEQSVDGVIDYIKGKLNV
jgi:UDP-glucose 4-epimerase